LGHPLDLTMLRTLRHHCIEDTVESSLELPTHAGGGTSPPAPVRTSTERWVTGSTNSPSDSGTNRPISI
ncbi:MAG: hypothetical protein M3439_04460, partial [Chloroflexota bacterium]|nr:hypothetical protein [Chloroflexota bacterium]